MQITRVVCPVEKYPIKCPDETVMEGITVHNTYNDASAMSEVSYMLGRPEKVSFHAAVDDYRVVEGLPFNRSCYAAGDGRYGFGNAKTINIEICYSKSGGERFDKAEELAAEYIAYLLKEYGWGIDKVGTHQMRSGKYCPHRTLDYGWDRFLNMIQVKLDELNKPPLSLQVQVHVAYKGWLPEVGLGEVAGTTGESRPMEAIILKSDTIDLEYRAHVANIGWLPWVKNGEIAGTTGESRSLEALEIRASASLMAQEHIQNVGWLPFSKGSNIILGTQGKSLAMEAILIDLQ